MQHLNPIPGGVTSFAELRAKGFAYVDKTPWIEQLERYSILFPLFERPHGFGKTLICDMLQAYYDEAVKSDFVKNFNGTYIFEHPTAKQGRYCVLRMCFSCPGVDQDGIMQAVLNEVRRAIADFLQRYPVPGAEEVLQRDLRYPDWLLRAFFVAVAPQMRGRLFVIIDDFDPYADHELATFRRDRPVAGRGWLTSLYGLIKNAERDSMVRRTFVTGVPAPSLGTVVEYFMAEILSQDPLFSDMFGVTVQELKDLIADTVELTEDGTDAVLEDMTRCRIHACRFAREGGLAVFNISACLDYLRNLAQGRGVQAGIA